MFELARKAHPLLTGCPAKLRAPHSRMNELLAEQLETAGYEILTWSPEAGVDSFVLSDRPGFLFFQGHPEYEATTLGREYLRDVSRYLRRHHESHPCLPMHYFSPLAAEALQRLSMQAQRTRDIELLGAYALAIDGNTRRTNWRPWSLHICRAWLSAIQNKEMHAAPAWSAAQRTSRH